MKLLGASSSRASTLDSFIVLMYLIRFYLCFKCAFPSGRETPRPSLFYTEGILPENPRKSKDQLEKKKNTKIEKSNGEEEEQEQEADKDSGLGEAGTC